MQIDPAKFAIVGGGWRAEFFLRVAQALPERFACVGVQTRDAGKGAALEAAWNVPTVRTMDELLRAKPAFVIVSVSWAAAPEMVRELSARGVPVLCETPPAPDLDGLRALYTDVTDVGGRVQVAEQYVFQPLHAARLALTASGRLGTVSEAQISVAHGYHGISLMRRFLGIDFEDAAIRARSRRSPLIEGPGRNGPPAAEKLGSTGQTIAEFDFGGERFGVFDFTDAQYFSWVRSHRVLVRGERGEINNTEVRYLLDYRTPVRMSLLRDDTGETGNLEGFYHRGILMGAEWLYRNPFPDARLGDDEIAVATAMVKMAEYADGGPDFYSLAEASQDHYLSLLMGQAAKSGEMVRSERQVWAE